MTFPSQRQAALVGAVFCSILSLAVAATPAPSSPLPCVVTSGGLSFDLAELSGPSLRKKSREASSFGWIYSFAACGDVGPSPACAGAAPNSAALQQTAGACYSLGASATRAVGATATGIALSFSGGDGGRSSVITVECADVVRPQVMRWSDGATPMVYVALVRARAGCALECARDATTGAVCGGAARGTCAADSISGISRCVCTSGFAGMACGDIRNTDLHGASGSDGANGRIVLGTVLLIVVAVLWSCVHRFVKSIRRRLLFQLLVALAAFGIAAVPATNTTTALQLPPRLPPALPVPNVVHFVFGLDSTFGHLKFGMMHYLAALGAKMYLKPDEILMHRKYTPSGEWWDCARPLFRLVDVESVTAVHGRTFLNLRVQHQADIIRMRIMREMGGIYLDSDVIPLRNFDELRHYNFSMGLEGDVGLCNAVMVGAPNTSFINRWWDEYVHFDPTQWNYHSVQLPLELMLEYPSEVHVMSERTFFYPLWNQLEALYDVDDGYD